MGSNAIGEIPVLITGDWSDLQVQLLAAEAASINAAKEIGESFTEAAKQFALFDNVGVPFADASGQLNLFTDSLEQFGHAAKDAAAPLAELPKATDEAVSGFHKFAEGVGEWIEHPLKSAGEAATSFIETMGPMGLVALAAGAGVFELGKQITELVLHEGAAAEATSNLANRLNLSFEETKQLSEMAQIAGISIDSLSRVSMRLADALQDPAGAGKKVATALHEMGINASDSGEALRQLLEKLADIPDATERISKAHEIMGRGAVQLEPLLRNYNELKAAVESLGGQLSGDLVNKLKEADDAADKLGIAWSHLKEHLAAAFAPAVTAGLNALTGLLAYGGSMTLDQQIASLKKEIVEMSDEATKGKRALDDMLRFGADAGSIDISGLLAAKKAALEMAQGQKDAFERSKEYNAELDKLAHDSQMREMTAKENQKKLDEAWHKQNLEDIKKEDKAREDAAKAGEKLNEDFIKSGQRLEEQSRRTQVTLDKAWYQYVLETRKAIGITDEAKHKFGELSEISVELKDRLPAPVMAAYEAALQLRGAYQLLGIDAAKSGTAMIAAFDTFAAAGKGDLEEVEIAWAKVSNQVDKLAKTNLPLAIREYEKYIALLRSNDSAIGQIFQTQEKLLELEIREKALRGESATEQIIQLEQIRNQMDALSLATRGLGQVYVDIMSAFHNAFGELSKGIASAIVDGKNLGDVFINVFKNLEKHILETTIGYVFKLLDAQLTKTGGILDTVAQKITKAVGLSFPGGSSVPGMPGGTPPFIPKIVYPPGTAPPVNLPDGIEDIPGGKGIPGGTSGGTGGGKTGGGTGGASSGLTTGLAVADLGVAIAAGITQGIQMSRLINLTGEIEVTTRKIQNEVVNLRTDEWTREDHLFNKLDDIWNEVRNVVSVLSLIGQMGGAGGGGNAEEFRQAVSSIVNLRAAESATKGFIDDLNNLAGETTKVAATLKAGDSIVEAQTAATKEQTSATVEVNKSFSDLTAKTWILQTKINDAVRLYQDQVRAGTNTVEQWEQLNRFIAGVHEQMGELAQGVEIVDNALRGFDHTMNQSSDSFSGFNSALAESSKALLFTVEELARRAAHNSSIGFADQKGQNAATMILPESLYGFHGYDPIPGSGFNSITGEMSNGTVGFAPGNNAGSQQIGYVTVVAVDPSGRQIADATIRGLETRGIRTR